MDRFRRLHSFFDAGRIDMMREQEYLGKLHAFHKTAIVPYCLQYNLHDLTAKIGLRLGFVKYDWRLPALTTVTYSQRLQFPILNRFSHIGTLAPLFHGKQGRATQKGTHKADARQESAQSNIPRDSMFGQPAA
jgi:hypothetical protein